MLELRGRLALLEIQERPGIQVHPQQDFVKLFLAGRLGMEGMLGRLEMQGQVALVALVEQEEILYIHSDSRAADVLVIILIMVEVVQEGIVQVPGEVELIRFHVVLLAVAVVVEPECVMPVAVAIQETAQAQQLVVLREIPVVAQAVVHPEVALVLQLIATQEVMLINHERVVEGVVVMQSRGSVPPVPVQVEVEVVVEVMQAVRAVRAIQAILEMQVRLRQLHLLIA